PCTCSSGWSSSACSPSESPAAPSGRAITRHWNWRRSTGTSSTLSGSSCIRRSTSSGAPDEPAGIAVVRDQGGQSGASSHSAESLSLGAGGVAGPPGPERRDGPDQAGHLEYGHQSPHCRNEGAARDIG